MPHLDYDDLAREYGRHRRVHPDVVGNLVDYGKLGPASRVLEVGCGTGNYTAALYGRLGCACWGVDPSAAMLVQAQVQCPAATFRLGTAEALPGATTFDLIFSVDVIHHLADRGAYFRRAAHALRPGGRICTVTDSEEIIRTRRPLAVYFPETVEVELARYPRIADLRAAMVAAGFTTVTESTVEQAYELTDVSPYRDKAFSSLHLIAPAAFRRGLAHLERDLRAGPVPCVSRYAMLWGTAGAGSID